MTCLELRGTVIQKRILLSAVNLVDLTISADTAIEGTDVGPDLHFPWLRRLNLAYTRDTDEFKTELVDELASFSSQLESLHVDLLQTTSLRSCTTLAPLIRRCTSLRHLVVNGLSAHQPVPLVEQIASRVLLSIELNFPSSIALMLVHEALSLCMTCRCMRSVKRLRIARLEALLDDAKQEPAAWVVACQKMAVNFGGGERGSLVSRSCVRAAKMFRDRPSNVVRLSTD